jgi:hypothetical protein
VKQWYVGNTWIILLTLEVNHLCNKRFRPLRIIEITLQHGHTTECVYTGMYKHLHSDDLVSDAIPCDLLQHHFPSDLACSSTLLPQVLQSTSLQILSWLSYSKLCLAREAWDRVLIFYFYMMSLQQHASFGSVSWCLCGKEWKHLSSQHGYLFPESVWHYVSYLFVTLLYFCNKYCYYCYMVN